jgi:hypothetical protein
VVLAHLGATQVTGSAMGAVTTIASHTQIDAGSGTAGDAVRASAQVAALTRYDRVSAAELGTRIEGNASTARGARDTPRGPAADGAGRAARSAGVAPVLPWAAKLFAIADSEAAGAIAALRFGWTAVGAAARSAIGADTGRSVPGLYSRARYGFRRGRRTASSLNIRNGRAGSDGAPQAEQPAQHPPAVATSG